MKVLLTCATSGIGTSIQSCIPEIEWILASRSGSHHLKLDFQNPSTFSNLAKNIGAVDGIVFIPPRVPPLIELFPENEQWMEYFRSSFVNPLAFLKAVINEQQLDRSLKIVFISGLSSVCALPHYGSANAVRLAWKGQLKSMALSLAEKGIRINTLSLGAVMTDFYQRKLRNKAELNKCSFEDQYKRETKNVPTGHYSTPENIAEAVRSLLGPMSDQMTGQNILMDGGFFRGY